MPVFEIEINGRSFEMDAPSADVAAAYARRVGSAVAASAPNVRDAFGIGDPTGHLDFNRTAPPQMMPPPQSDLSYRAERAGNLGNNVVRSAASGIPILGGPIDRAAGPSESYEQFQKDHPIMAWALPVIGGVGSMLPLVAAAPAAFGIGTAPLAARMAVGGATGGAIGAGDAATRGNNVGIGAGIGAVTGGAAPAIGRAIGHALGGRAARQVAPTTDDLRAGAQAAYTAADNAGLVLEQPSYNNFALGLINDVQGAGFNARLHPGIAAALDEVIQAANRPLTLRDMDILRRVVRGAGSSATTNPDQARIAGIMVDRLDDYLATLGPGDIAAGNAQAGTAALAQARDLWSRARKGDVVEDIFERARNATGANYTTAGMETALRQQFRSLANNRKLFRTFTDDEQAAILGVVRGGPVQNVVRMIGKFAPHGIISTTMSSGAGYALGGPVGAVALPLVGEAARRSAAATTIRGAEGVGAMVRSGPVYTQNQNIARALMAADATRLMQTFGVPNIPRLSPERLPAKP